MFPLPSTFSEFFLSILKEERLLDSTESRLIVPCKQRSAENEEGDVFIETVPLQHQPWCTWDVSTCIRTLSHCSHPTHIIS